MQTEENKFSQYLESKGLKLTSERRVILKEIFSAHDHFEAEDILVRIRNKGARVSKDTIYRTLPLLAEAGLIREVALGERHGHYEHILSRQHHDHLICLKCNRVFEFSNGTIEEIQDKVCKTHDFKAQRHNLTIFGLCKKCR